MALFGKIEGENESRRSYMDRFLAASLEVPDTSEETRTTILVKGLRHRDFFKLLAKKTPSGYDDLQARVGKFIRLEKAEWGKERR